MKCQPRSEEQFKPVISDNYYSGSHFWFELDHVQANNLISLLSSLPITASTSAPQSTTRWRDLFQTVPSHDRREELEGLNLPVLKIDFPNLYKSTELGSSDIAISLDADDHQLKNFLDKQVVKKEEEDFIYMKLKELTHNRKLSDLPSTGEEDGTHVNDVDTWRNDITEAQMLSAKWNEERKFDSVDYPSVITSVCDHSYHYLSKFLTSYSWHFCYFYLVTYMLLLLLTYAVNPRNGSIEGF